MSRELPITTAHVSQTRMPDPVQVKLEQAFIRYAIPLIRRSVVPLFAADHKALDRSSKIYVVQGDPLVRFGSATLFQRSGCFYLVTAAHILKEWQAEAFELRIGINDRARPLAPAIEHSVIDEKLDIAVIRLKKAAAMAINNAIFLTDSHILKDDALPQGRYFIPGYLAHRSAFSSDRQSLGLSSLDLLTWSQAAHSGSAPQFGFLDYPTQPTFSATTLGTAPGLESVGGMSGANVWRVWQHREDLVADWNVSTVRVVGVQISQADDRSYLKCTLWKHVIPLIAQLSG
jgi:hypothetical protein